MTAPSTLRLLLVTLFLLTTAVPLTAGTGPDERAAILAMMQRQVEGWNTGSIDAFMEGYRRSDSLRFASGGEVTYGWRTMLERYRRGYPTRERMGRLVFSDVSVDILSPDAAAAFGRWTLHRDTDAPTGLFTLILRKRPEGWRIVHDHTSAASAK